MKPSVDVSASLGDTPRGASWEIRSLTVEEQAKVRDAKERSDRGANVRIPDFKPTVYRGAIGIVAPNIYYFGAWFRADVADHPTLLAEHKQILASFRYYDTTARPARKRLGKKTLGNTRDDPALDNPRTKTVLHSTEGLRKIYKMRVRYATPPGFVSSEEKSRNTSIRLVAQDANNHWVDIKVFHENKLATGEQNSSLVHRNVMTKRWGDYWKGLVPDATTPKKAQSVKLGRLRGKGLQTLTGQINGWRATYTALMFAKSNWQTYVTMETRGDADVVFKKEIKAFFNSLRFTYKVK